MQEESKDEKLARAARLLAVLEPLVAVVRRQSRLSVVMGTRLREAGVDNSDVDSELEEVAATIRHLVADLAEFEGELGGGLN